MPLEAVGPFYTPEDFQAWATRGTGEWDTRSRRLAQEQVDESNRLAFQIQAKHPDWDRAKIRGHLADTYDAWQRAGGLDHQKPVDLQIQRGPLEQLGRALQNLKSGLIHSLDAYADSWENPRNPMAPQSAVMGGLARAGAFAVGQVPMTLPELGMLAATGGAGRLASMAGSGLRTAVGLPQVLSGPVQATARVAGGLAGHQIGSAAERGPQGPDTTELPSVFVGAMLGETFNLLRHAYTRGLADPTRGQEALGDLKRLTGAWRQTKLDEHVQYQLDESFASLSKAIRRDMLPESARLEYPTAPPPPGSRIHKFKAPPGGFAGITDAADAYMQWTAKALDKLLPHDAKIPMRVPDEVREAMAKSPAIAIPIVDPMGNPLMHVVRSIGEPRTVQAQSGIYEMTGKTITRDVDAREVLKIIQSLGHQSHVPVAGSQASGYAAGTAKVVDARVDRYDLINQLREGLQTKGWQDAADLLDQRAQVYKRAMFIRDLLDDPKVFDRERGVVSTKALQERFHAMLNEPAARYYEPGDIQVISRALGRGEDLVGAGVRAGGRVDRPGIAPITGLPWIGTTPTGPRMSGMFHVPRLYRYVGPPGVHETFSLGPAAQAFTNFETTELLQQLQRQQQPPPPR